MHPDGNAQISVLGVFFLAILRLMAVGWLVGGGFGTFIKQEIGGGFAFAFNLNFTAIL